MTDDNSSKSVVPRFESLVGRSGVHVHDPVEDVQAMLFTDRQVDPEPASPDGFVYPVDSATRFYVSRIRTPFLIDILVRNREGDIIEKISPENPGTDVRDADYLIEFAGMGMKMYAKVDGCGFHIEPGEDGIDIQFNQETALKIGARSTHFQPARTLKTTSKPEDLMEAVSLFGNAMKTWSPERTWPSLRGHPPLIELDTEPDIPDGLTPPETAIEISVPPKHAWVYPVAPLAYWLGATIRPGDPELQVDGKTYVLGDGAGYAGETEREAFEKHLQDVLQFSFILDCAARTEGFYDAELDARRRVEAVGLPLDFERLYEMPIAGRLRTYLELDISFEEMAGRIGRPDWRLTADVQPDPNRATSLPFLARDLAVVRCPTSSKLDQTSETVTEGMEDVFARSPSPDVGSVANTGAEVAYRSSFTSNSSQSSRAGERIIGLPETDSMSQAWIGDGFAIGAAKASTQSYLQRLEQHAEDASGINIDVVVNDAEMADEATVSEIYGTRDHLEFDIDLHHDLSTDDLADVFESETDFIHYIGHVDPEGFDCHDGYLHADQLETVCADTFVLNACASYEQGQLLVDNGAIAGVVTLEDVINSLATKVGKTVARLLNFGFPIGSATSLIQETIFTGSNYVVVGDSNAALAQSNVAIPNVVRVELRKDGKFDVTVETFASWNYDTGSMYRPYLDRCDCHYVVPGELDTWRVGDPALDEFLNISTFPIIGCGNLYWSDEITAEDLREQLRSYN
ncbi:hypothetical protein HWV07_15100 [Natronomonas salina]|uniref:hypothetical protein n=1 Tax=Natronomonas salina TaxID=1710540 RepID=UPI0015B5E1FB|nr:hypothetical protein [Natronomonas salina]QLD90290.1 hypothetical protein HWV07_15100 [Natronomonas salina]